MPLRTRPEGVTAADRNTKAPALFPADINLKPAGIFQNQAGCTLVSRDEQGVLRRFLRAAAGAQRMPLSRFYPRPARQSASKSKAGCAGTQFHDCV